MITELEHHSNFVPWQFVANCTGASLPHPDRRRGRAAAGRARRDRGLRKGQGRRQQPRLELARDGQPSREAGRVGARAGRDHGRRCGAGGAAPAARRAGARLRLPRDLLPQALRAERCRRLWGRAELLEQMSPFNLGGEMIRSVALDRTSWNELPYKFEAGTPAIAEAYGFGIAIDYLSEIGLEAIERHEHELTGYALGRLAELDFVRVRAAARTARRDRLVRRRRHPSTRRRADPRLGRRGRSGRAPLHAAADDAPRRRGDDARELLRLRSPRRSTGWSKACTRSSSTWDERVRPAVSRGHPRPLQEPRGHGLLDAADAQAEARTRSAATR